MGRAAARHSDRADAALLERVLKEQDKFAELIARETGKPLWEARAEVESVIAKVEISVRAYAERTGQRKARQRLQGTSAVRHKPHGVMAVLGPFNFPAHLPNGHIVPALIAGNAVVFKPSEKTPAVGEFLLKCFHKAGVSAAVVQLLVGGPEEGKALVAHDGIDGVLFTGSAQVGIAINRKLAANPGKIVALEMGGNNPIVLWDTPKIAERGDADRAIGLHHRRPALHRGPPADRQVEPVRPGDRGGERLTRPDHRRRAVRRAGAVHGPGDRQAGRRPADRELPLPAVERRQVITHLRAARRAAVRHARPDRHTR
jgi:hypothetical protein